MSVARFFLSRALKSASRSRSRFARRRASVMVETALCVTFVLLPLTVGIVQYGVILSAEHQLDQLAREGGRYASVHGGEINFDSDENTTGSLKAYLKSITDGKTIIPWADVKDGITVTPVKGSSTPRTSGQPISVVIVYSIKKKFFLATFPGMGNLSPNYNAKSTFVLE